MLDVPYFLHTAIINGATGCGKTYQVMKMLSSGGEYYNYFDVVIVLCPTFMHNSTYKMHYDVTFGSPKINNYDTHFYYINPNDPDGAWIINPRAYGRRPIDIQEWIACLSNQFLGCETLFVLDDLIADPKIKQKRNALCELAVSGRHTRRSLWLLTQKYNGLGKDVRDQAMFIISFWSKDKKSFANMINENNANISNEDIKKIERELGGGGKRSFIYIKCFKPIGYTLFI